MRAANAAGTSAVDVRRGTNQLVSGLIDADRLVLTNAAGRFEFLGGTLITRGAFLTNGSEREPPGRGAMAAEGPSGVDLGQHQITDGHIIDISARGVLDVFLPYHVF